MIGVRLPLNSRENASFPLPNSAVRRRSSTATNFTLHIPPGSLRKKSVFSSAMNAAFDKPKAPGEASSPFARAFSAKLMGTAATSATREPFFKKSRREVDMEHTPKMEGLDSVRSDFQRRASLLFLSQSCNKKISKIKNILYLDSSSNIVRVALYFGCVGGLFDPRARQHKER